MCLKAMIEMKKEIKVNNAPPKLKQKKTNVAWIAHERHKGAHYNRRE